MRKEGEFNCAFEPSQSLAAPSAPKTIIEGRLRHVSTKGSDGSDILVIARIRDLLLLDYGFGLVVG